MVADTHSAQARNPDFAPDLTEDSYWDIHHIALVRVTDLDTTKRDGSEDDFLSDRVSFEVIREFTDASVARRQSAPMLHFWFGADLEDWPRLRAGDHLVVFLPRRPMQPIAAQMTGESPHDDSLVHTLLRIAALRRGEGGLNALREGVFSDDRTVALYCIKRMMTRGVVDLDEYTRRLRALRDDHNRHAEVRLLASELAQRLLGEPRESTQEYAWVTRSFEQSTTDDVVQLHLFGSRLVDFEEKREETVRLLTRFARNPNLRFAARMTAIGLLSDSRLLSRGNPDAASMELFDTAVALLEDTDVTVRIGASDAVRRLCTRIMRRADRAVAERFLSRAATAVKTALDRETELVVSQHLRLDLDFIERGAKWESHAPEPAGHPRSKTCP